MADDTPQDDELDLTDDELDQEPDNQPAEDDADEAGGADEDDGSDEEPEQEDTAASQEPPPPRQPASRAGRTVAALRADRRKQAEELAALRREMAELRQSRQAAPVQQEDPRVEQERLALMSPEERMEYRLDKSLKAHQQQTSAMVFNMQQTQDKTAWDARAAGDKLRSKLAADVEREYQACIARGQYLPRENIYIYLVGQRFLSNRGKGDDGKAARRVEKERVKPASGRGDVQPERRAARAASGSTSDFERRYGDIQI